MAMCTVQELMVELDVVPGYGLSHVLIVVIIRYHGMIMLLAFYILYF
jgi:hypothetical protein